MSYGGIRLQLSGRKGRNLEVNFPGSLKVLSCISNNNPTCMEKVFHLGGLRASEHLAPLWTVVEKQNRGSYYYKKHSGLCTVNNEVKLLVVWAVGSDGLHVHLQVCIVFSLTYLSAYQVQVLSTEPVSSVPNCVLVSFLSHFLTLDHSLHLNISL